jgi:hypothetical protein
MRFWLVGYGPKGRAVWQFPNAFELNLFIALYPREVKVIQVFARQYKKRPKGKNKLPAFKRYEL